MSCCDNSPASANFKKDLCLQRLGGYDSAAFHMVESPRAPPGQSPHHPPGPTGPALTLTRPYQDLPLPRPPALLSLYCQATRTWHNTVAWSLMPANVRVLACIFLENPCTFSDPSPLPAPPTPPPPQGWLNHAESRCSAFRFAIWSK